MAKLNASQKEYLNSHQDVTSAKLAKATGLTVQDVDQYLKRKSTKKVAKPVDPPQVENPYQDRINQLERENAEMQQKLMSVPQDTPRESKTKRDGFVRHKSHRGVVTVSAQASAVGDDFIKNFSPKKNRLDKYVYREDENESVH